MPHTLHSTKIPVHGALVKLCQDERCKQGSVPGLKAKVLTPFRKRASTLTSISEQSEHRSYDDRVEPGGVTTGISTHCSMGLTIPKSATPPASGHCRQTPAWNGATAKAGTIKALGESVRGKFSIDDPVLAFFATADGASPSSSDEALAEEHDDPQMIHSIAIRGGKYVIVQNAMEHLFHVPANISLATGSVLASKGVLALAFVQQLHQMYLADPMQTAKVLFVCPDEVSLLCVPLFINYFDNCADNFHLTLATLKDKGVVWLKKKFPQ